MRNTAFPPSTAARSRSLSLAVLMLMCAVAGCGLPGGQDPEDPDAQPTPLETITAEVITVSPQTWPKVIRSQGSLYADEESIVGAKVAGRVAEVNVDFGDFVERGDVLVSLDLEEFQVQVSQAEAQLQQARSAVGLGEGDSVASLDRKNAPPVREAKALWESAQSVLKRAESLKTQDAIAQGEYDQAAADERVAEARYASALNSVREKIALIAVREAELSLSRQRLQDAVITAPLDGYVQDRQVAVGTYLVVGQPIAVVVRTHPLRFRGTVPERHAQSLAVGQKLELKIESVDEAYNASIARISPSLDQQSRALVFEARIDNQDHTLRTGLFVEAEVVIDPQAQALVAPESALIEFAGTQKVWKVTDGVAGEQEVLTGARRDEGREIIHGLSAGDTILRDAARGRIAKIRPPSDSGDPVSGESSLGDPDSSTSSSPRTGSVDSPSGDSESS